MSNTLLASPNSFALEPAAGSSLPSSAEQNPGKRRNASLSNLSPEQRKRRRASQLAAAKQRSRAKAASLGDRTITITVTGNEAALLEALREKQRGPLEGFFRRALILGATFAANAGNPRGRKVKGNTNAAAIRGTIVDKSTKEAA